MPHLVGKRIILREYRWDDLKDIRNWVNDEKITQYLADNFTYPNSLHETETFLTMMIEGTGTSKGFVIADKDSQEYIGQIDFHQIDLMNKFAILGIVIGRTDRLNQGYGREAIKLLQDFAFLTLNLHRLELEVFEYNDRAYHCYLKCGFKEEGRLRKKIYRKGQYWDVIKMGILKSEYYEKYDS